MSQDLTIDELLAGARADIKRSCVPGAPLTAGLRAEGYLEGVEAAIECLGGAAKIDELLIKDRLLQRVPPGLSPGCHMVTGETREG